ncbi:nuclear transport factor 2 family protein [Kitasatospora sp. NPDC004669]|uniref:nuclear transport factor 2 family protein n=1 Tax=Kitasatospora sp. NPDC004669 TaxID=3154555 RepID=UPI0033AB53D0
MADTEVEDLAQLDQYVRFWNADGEEQSRLAAAVFAEGVEYRAMVGVLSGAEALIDLRKQFVAHLGAVALRLRRTPEVHHQRARIEWELLTGGGEGEGTSFAEGTDMIQLDEDGRITAVTVFVDRVPEGFDGAAHH